MRKAVALFIFIICGFFYTYSANAALLYFDPGEASIHRGDTIGLTLRIDPDENECINTIDAVIRYDESIKAEDVSRGDSILSLWVEPPVIDEANRTIKFAGGLPGGYCGRIPGDPSLTNVVLKVIFRSPGLSIGAKDASSPRVWIDDSAQVLLHDGLGTNAPLRLQDARLVLLDTPGQSISDSWTSDVQADNDPPSEFSIILAREENAFSGKYFITFNALDKQSGIDHYEVMEESLADFNAFKWGRADAPWIRTESPYVLTDQSLNSTIRVRALDKAGNERIAVLVPDEALRRMSLDLIILIGIAGGVLVLLTSLVGYAIWKRKKTKQQESSLVSHVDTPYE